MQPASKLSGALWRRSGIRKESLQLRLWNLIICIGKVDAKCWLGKSSPSFSRPAARAPRRACSQATRGKVNTTELGYKYVLPGALTAKYCYGFSSFTFYKSQISRTAEPRDGFYGFSSFLKTLCQRIFQYQLTHEHSYNHWVSEDDMQHAKFELF